MAENILHDYAESLPGGVTLVPGSGGVFNVTFGDRNLFSKTKLERFPEATEIEDKLAELFET